MRPLLRAAAIGWLLLSAAALPAVAEPPFITVASTTSTEESGLFGYLLPAFTKETGIDVRLVAVGTGQALKIGERGDCDVVFVHDRPAELAFVEHGFGIDRREVMYNGFVLIGPAGDPAHVDGGTDIVAALRQIADAKARFVARGDDSGTSKAEVRFWKEAGLDPRTIGAGWYRDTGSGMGPTLNTTAAMDAYTLSDRGTWLNFKNRQNLSRTSRNQTGDFEDAPPSAIRAIWDDLPIHIRPNLPAARVQTQRTQWVQAITAHTSSHHLRFVANKFCSQAAMSPFVRD